MSETSDCLLCSCLCVKKLIKNTTSETCCVKNYCQDTPKRAVHAEGGVVSINTVVKSEDTEITDTRNHRHEKSQTHYNASLKSVLKLSPRR